MATNANTKYWGEIDDGKNSSNSTLSEEECSSPDVTVEIERSMNKFCLAEFDLDYDDATTEIEHITLRPMDPLIMYTISLHKYANEMNEMIRVAELAIESNVIPPVDAAPVMPEMPQIKRLHARNNLNYIPKEFTSFSIGHGLAHPDISWTVTRGILTKCIAIMLAHIGYETTHHSILDLLTDVIIEFLRKITYHMKLAYEDEVKGYFSGFPHIAERVLVELGMGGIKGLHDYYQSRIIKYIDVVQKRCRELNKHYESLLIHKSLPSNEKDNKLVRVQVEEDDDVIEIDNPQVHLAMDGDVGFSSLDAGYQLLSSLEAGTT